MLKLSKKISIIILSLGVLLITILIGGYLITNFNSNDVLVDDFTSPIINSNTLTMMYETESGSVEYQTSSDTTWPKEGYTFNEKLSKCERGCTLSWDEDNKKVLLQANTLINVMCILISMKFLSLIK